MPTRPRNARKSKNAHAKLSSGPSSADASASQTPLSPPVQLPTPLPEPQERIRATLARVEGVEAGRGEGGETERGEAEAHDERREYAEEFGYLQRGGGGPQDEEEEFVPPPPQVEVDEDGDVLGQLIDFGSLPSSPPSMPPPRLPADPHFDQVPVSQHGQQQEGHDVSLSGFLNDTHRREEDTNPFGVSAATYEEEPRETPFDSQTAYPYPRALLGGEAASEGSQPGLDGGEDEAEGGEEAEEAEEEEGERVVYKSPPFMQVGLPEVEEDAVVPGREAETAEKEEGGLGLGIPGRTGREGGMGHVRAPTVVVNSRSSSSSASSSHVRSLSSASTTSSSINPPSLTLDLSTSSSGSAFGSLSKTIRSYAPSLPMGITSPGGKGSRKSAPYPPLVSRPVVAGRVESGYGGGTMKSPYEQEFEREYERDWEDEGRVGEPFNYGYSVPSTLSRTPVTPTSRAATPSRVATSTSTSTAALRTASTGYSRAPSATTSRPASASRTTTTVPVPDRQRAWPEYASSSSPAQGPPSTVVSRHRATRSQGSQATLASGLASGLTQTLRGGVDAVSSRSSTPSTLMGTSAQARVEGEGDDVIERVVWARWDTLEKRQVLVVGYERGVQVWDAGRLGSVAEVLNVNFGKAKDGWVDGKKGEKVKSVVKGMVVPGSTELVIL
ncbi:hypothetical protein FA13DRAFT_1739867 [Coprinellus micaceus]|uniref:Uncharacterized protein n=1 Tax=Coprinellus micaceus TaxID=71717 RepID=A0A4Y7SPP5_COPMI|nr:hypothetical protein FA13DRAFT_1739867 [Coprinellus micaceus]